MLNDLLRSYMAFMLTGDTGLMLHLVGPPGSGKSSVVEQLAELTGARLHKISVPRLSPLEVEGLQMPTTTIEGQRLELLLATHWNTLQEGDIVFFDEFLAGFPEVYAALLDIFTSREVGGSALPRVFMIAASNTAVAPTPAMADRLMHLPVKDPRNAMAERRKLAELLVEETGMLPASAKSLEMEQLLEEVVLPTFDVLDHILGKKPKNAGQKSKEGKSLRNLIGQVKLRMVRTPQLKQLIEMNNRMAILDKKPQYVILTGKPPAGYERMAKELELMDSMPGVLTKVQSINLQMNLQMLELAEARQEKEEDA